MSRSPCAQHYCSGQAKSEQSTYKYHHVRSIFRGRYSYIDMLKIGAMVARLSSTNPRYEYSVRRQTHPAAHRPTQGEIWLPNPARKHWIRVHRNSSPRMTANLPTNVGFVSVCWPCCRSGHGQLKLVEEPLDEQGGRGCV